MKKARSNASMFQEHPVSHVIRVPAETVQANDYNPNTVAPPEMRLLELSIKSDGFTQPIVCWQTEDHYEGRLYLFEGQKLSCNRKRMRKKVYYSINDRRTGC